MRRTPVPPVWLVKPALAARTFFGRIPSKMTPPLAEMVDRMNAIIDVKALHVAAELGLADVLARSPRTPAEVASEVGADPDATGRLLGYLAARGVVKRSGGGRYRNTVLGEVLRTDHPESARPWVLWFGSSWHFDILKELGHSVRTGGSGTSKAFGAEFFDYLNRVEPEAGATFNRALAAMADALGPVLATKFDFAGITTLCDVGGGTGTPLAQILEHHPEMRGVVFDMPELADDAKANLTARGLDGRCEFVGGDFFEAVPSGCDAYLLEAVVHDWDNASCVRILQTIRNAMPPGGKVLVVESVVGALGGDAETLVRAFDLLMLVTSGSGRERTRVEFDALFAQAGFRVARDVTLPTLLHVLELARV